MTEKPKAHHRASPLLIHEPPLLVLPSLAVAIGLNEAIVLQQIHYWLGTSKNSHDGRLWVYNTYEQWGEQFPFWSPEFIRKIVKSLRDKNLIEARQLSPNAWDKTNSYTINYEVLESIHAGGLDAVKSTASKRKNRPHRSGEKEVVHAVKSTASKRANPPHLHTETTSQTTQRDTPIPPAPQAPGASGSKATAISLATWLSNLKASGELPIPEDDPVFEYAEQAGIPLDMLRLCWIEFRSRYSEPGAKRYKDWRSVYRKAVRGNWLKLWFCNADGYTLTTAGLQAQRALQAKEGLAA